MILEGLLKDAGESLICTGGEDIQSGEEVSVPSPGNQVVLGRTKGRPEDVLCGNEDTSSRAEDVP